MRQRRLLVAAASGAHALLSWNCCYAFAPISTTPGPARPRPSFTEPREQSRGIESTPPPPLPLPPFHALETNLRRGASTLAVAAALFFAVLAAPTAPAAALTENQQFVSDVWFAVTAQYFDPTFNGMNEDGWRARKAQAITAVADSGPEDDALVAEEIQRMLSALDDPYTRFLPREKFEALTAYARGGSAGIGVQLLLEPRLGNVVVMRTEGGSPAAAAGIRAGDTIVGVDGESMEGATAELVAAKCRGEPGERVEVTVRRGSGGSSGGGDSGGRTERLSMTRSQVKVNPGEAATFASGGGNRIGLLRVPSFSQETPGQMIDALRFVARDGGVAELVIDLRGNVGGYMTAGVDCAKLFLPARAHIIAEVGKGGGFRAYDADGLGAELEVPLYLLVDRRTASAAEIFACALQDNGRALVVGTTTFGKGRIQNVQSVGNGSGVAVTRARYVTPRGRDIHGVGIRPNIEKDGTQCGQDDSAAACLADVIA